MLSFVANFPRAVLGTRVNPERQIRFEYGYVWKWKLFLGGLQKYLDSKILCAIYSLQVLSETTSRTQDQEFLLSFFQLSSDEKLLEE